MRSLRTASAGLVIVLASACAGGTPAATTVPTAAAASPSPTAAPTATPAPATPAASSTPNALAIPAIPAPVAVTLDAKTTALGVFDVTNPTCAGRPECAASVPKIATLLGKARDAGVLVLFSSTSATGTFPPEIAPKAGEATVQPVAGIADLFLRSSTATPTFDQTLKDKKITTLLLTGTRSNGVVLYTAFGAVARGYTVVVAIDGISGSVPVESNLAMWQMLNQPGFTNADNKPLAEKLVTLTRSDLITFK